MEVGGRFNDSSSAAASELLVTLRCFVYIAVVEALT